MRELEFITDAHNRVTGRLLPPVQDDMISNFVGVMRLLSLSNKPLNKVKAAFL